MTDKLPEFWLRGPVAGFEPLLMPVAHALLQAREDLERVAADASARELWEAPGAAATAGYHLQHLAGSLDRLLTYARGDSLDERQRQALAHEGTAGAAASELVAEALRTIDRALEQVLRATSPETLLESRAVGRARLPATVIGLLCHAAEHTTRHVGQLITTLKIVRGIRALVEVAARGPLFAAPFQARRFEVQVAVGDVARHPREQAADGSLVVQRERRAAAGRRHGVMAVHAHARRAGRPRKLRPASSAATIRVTLALAALSPDAPGSSCATNSGGARGDWRHASTASPAGWICPLGACPSNGTRSYAKDPAKLTQFYTQLFDWTVEEVPGMDHRFIKTVATDVQGMPTQTGGINGGPVARPEGFNDRARGNYVNVDSLDASVARATSLGATPMKGRTAVPGMGWLAMLSDPDGNTLAMWQQDSAAK